jgi:predicted transcriptional regulator
MTIFGVLGGSTNYLLLKEKKNTTNCTLLKSIFLGVTASFLVPLFLNMISSTLLQDSLEDPHKLLIFAGFCLIASISSRAFINAMSDKILKEVQKSQEELKDEVDSFKSEMEPILNKETELENNNIQIVDKDTTLVLEQLDNELRIFNNDTDEVKIFKAIGNSKYTYRTKEAIMKCTGINDETLTPIINMLISRRFIRLSSKDGKQYYGLTTDGRIRLNDINKYIEGTIIDFEYKENKSGKKVYSVLLDNDIKILVYLLNDVFPFEKGSFIQANTVDGERADIKHVSKNNSSVE